MPENSEVSDKNPLYEAINAAAEAAETFAMIARDPYKAPEMVIEQIGPLQYKLWQAHVEYAATDRRRHG